MQKRIEKVLMSTLNILMVDDESDLDLLVQQRFREKIQKGHYHFTFARNGQKALEILRQHPEIQVVITDLNMPEMNGYELLLKIRQEYSHLKIIVLSAYSDPESVALARKSGASDFLTKPINFKEMEEKIRETGGHTGNGHPTGNEHPTGK